MSAVALTDPITLPCGLTLPNRLGRAAMTEGLADARNNPTDRHVRLYEANASGGAGLILTGNAMVDRRHLERARNVVLDSLTDRLALTRWAEAAGPHALVQISHPGRQTNRFVQSHPVSPSGGAAVELAGLFARPKALSVEEIVEVRTRFIAAGRLAVDAGFAGVQVHGAHGYLLSSFLDPDLNRRSDQYGGGIEGRSKLLLETVGGLKAALPDHAAVAVKLDARDGGEEDLAWLGNRLGEEGADLLEISGGNYEAPAMLGFEADGSVIRSAHESPFWQGAEAVSGATSVPVMLTGGFRTRAGVDQALESGVADMVGVGRPLAVRPELAGEFLRGETDVLDRPAPRITGPALVQRLSSAAANSGWHRLQMKQTSRGEPAKLELSAPFAAINYIAADAALALRSRRTRMKLAARTRPSG
jgi:2,4-dienoyl-CoA reductase-like NADH-dependent reductase (Old Yellow Enzyme family)